MSDALSSALSRGNVLSSIANPTVVNPLAAYAGAVQTARGVYDLRNQQADQAWGQALQQATDPQTGVVDYPKAQALAASNPMAQMGMARNLANSSALRGQQQEQAMRHMSLVGGAALSVMNDPSDENLARVGTSLINSGMPASVVNQEMTTMKGMSQEDRAKYAYQHGIAAMAPGEAMARVGGQTGAYNVGGGIQGGTLTQPAPGRPGSFTSGQGGGLATTPTPEWWGETIKVPDDQQFLPDGRRNPHWGDSYIITRRDYYQQTGRMPPGAPPGTQPPDGSLGTGRYPPPSLRNPNAPPPAAPSPAAQPPAGAPPTMQQGGPPPAPPGAPAGSPAAPGGIGTVPWGPKPTSMATPPASPVAGDVGAILQGIQQARAGAQPQTALAAGPAGVPAAGAAPPAQPTIEPFGSAPGSYSFGPSVPTMTVTAPRPPAAAPAPAQPGRLYTDVGPGELDYRQGRGPFAAHAQEDINAQGQQTTLANMLADTAQFTTGPLAGITGRVRNMAVALGIPGVNTEAQSARESFGKLASGLANAQGAGSDARMNVNISANPHEELSPAGVDLVIRQLQGNTDFIRARAKLAANWTGSHNDYAGFQSSIAGLDPRVFQLRRMTQPQREAYLKSLDSAARRQIDAAIDATDQLTGQ